MRGFAARLPNQRSHLLGRLRGCPIRRAFEPRALASLLIDNDRGRDAAGAEGLDGRPLLVEQHGQRCDPVCGVEALYRSIPPRSVESGSVMAADTIMV